MNGKTFKNDGLKGRKQTAKPLRRHEEPGSVALRRKTPGVCLASIALRHRLKLAREMLDLDFDFPVPPEVKKMARMVAVIYEIAGVEMENSERGIQRPIAMRNLDQFTALRAALPCIEV